MNKLPLFNHLNVVQFFIAQSAVQRNCPFVAAGNLQAETPHIWKFLFHKRKKLFSQAMTLKFGNDIGLFQQADKAAGCVGIGEGQEGVARYFTFFFKEVSFGVWTPR